MSALGGWLALQAAIGHHVPVALLGELPREQLGGHGLWLATDDGELWALHLGDYAACKVSSAHDARGHHIDLNWWPPGILWPHQRVTVVVSGESGFAALFCCQGLWPTAGGLRLECVTPLARLDP